MALVLKKVICAGIMVLMLFLWTACEPEGAGPSEVLLSRSDMLAGFSTAELDIMGLTEITVNSGQADGEKVKVYVDLKDSLMTCLRYLWPLLEDRCCVFTHEASHMEIASLFLLRTRPIYLN